MKIKDVEHKVKPDDFEHRVLIACLNAARTVLVEQGKPTEDVDELFIKIINVPSKKVSVRVLLLFETLEYETAIKALEEVLESGMLKF